MPGLPPRPLRGPGREIGPVGIVLANAGIAPLALPGREPYQSWRDVIDVNLTGVFNAVETAIASMIERGQGGAIVLVSSTAGINGIGGPTRGGLGYTASKHGVVGLMRSYANILGPHRIRVNSVHPTGVNTPMVVNEVMQEILAQDPQMSNPDGNALPVGMVEAMDISNAIAWLVPMTLGTLPGSRCRSTPASPTRSKASARSKNDTGCVTGLSVRMRLDR
jgi:NAD(P)-dependent dehydrogenase (short-subunit alcohol dehydrogenase family)